MAKKKDLTPYQKARRQFVQQRVEARGVEGTPEERKQFRQRFDVLASTVEGRGKIARQLNVEEPKTFRRMLATEMPGRKLDNTSGGSTGGTSYKVPTAQEITAGWQKAVSSGTYKVPTTSKKASSSSASTGGTTTGPVIQKTSSGNWWTNRRSNIIGQGINYPGRQTLNNLMNPLGKGGPITDWSPKGLAKYVGYEAAEAAIIFPATRVAAGTLKAGAAVSRFGLKTVARFMPKLGDKTINPRGGVGKNPYGPPAPAGGPKPQLALGPGPAPASSSAAASASRSTAASRGPRINTKGGVGSKPYGPAAPKTQPKTQTKTQPKTSTTKSSKDELSEIEAEFGKVKFADADAARSAASKTQPKTRPKTQPKTKTSKEEAEDLAYTVAQMKNRFPGMTEKDIPFIGSLGRAQIAIEKRASGWESYQKWLSSPQTQATLRRLRGK